MHQSAACPSESPHVAGNKSPCGTWGMTGVEFPLGCRRVQWFIKEKQPVSRSAAVRRESEAGGGGSEEASVGDGAWVSIHMVSQLVGGPVVRSRRSYASSHTIADYFTRNLSSQKEAMWALGWSWTGAADAHFPLLRLLSLTSSGAVGGGRRPNGWHTKLPLYLGMGLWGWHKT